jgi:uncharacterized protein GlcG (DUF336 family)
VEVKELLKGGVKFGVKVKVKGGIGVSPRLGGKDLRIARFRNWNWGGVKVELGI